MFSAFSSFLSFSLLPAISDVVGKAKWLGMGNEWDWQEKIGEVKFSTLGTVFLSIHKFFFFFT